MTKTLIAVMTWDNFTWAWHPRVITENDAWVAEVYREFNQVLPDGHIAVVQWDDNTKNLVPPRTAMRSLFGK